MTFDAQETPMLKYGWHPEHRMHGWWLWYVVGNGVEHHFTPGDLADVDEVVEWAREARPWEVPHDDEE